MATSKVEDGRSRRRVVIAALSLALLTACDGQIHGDSDGGVELPRCDPPIVAVARDIVVAPYDIAVIRVTGGTGRPRFSLQSDGETGSRVDATTGVFVAGALPGDEAVRVTDERCDDDAIVRIEVTEGLALAPATAEVAPGDAIAFEVRGGTGTFTFDMALSASGGTIDATGRYVAGATEGDDRVRVTDTTSGDTAEATVRVRAGAGLMVPTTRLGVPVGSRYVLTPTGGSGVVDVTSSTGSFTIEEGDIVATSVGDATLTVRDHFTSDEVTIAASALASRTAPSLFVGDRGELNSLVVEDFDQDGRNDLAIALPGSGHEAWRAGAVLLYPGTAGGGLMGRPARVLHGVRREDAFGSALGLADLDGDGVDDLIVGVWQDDSVGSNAGAVHVYQGIPGRFFDDEPYLSLFGAAANDRFGIAVTACDFDGDGDVDLAVGAADDEDNAISPAISNQGAVHVFANYDGRILGRGDVVLFGAIPDATGALVSHRDMRFGSALASGDVDGDGLCDLIAQMQRPDPTTANDGAIAVYRGVAPEAGRAEGGVAEVPSVVWAAMDAGDRGSRFGAFLAAGDLDDDGLTDIAAGAPSHDRPMMGSDPAVSDLGAVRVFRGGALDAMAMAITPASASDLFLEGLGGSAILGHGVAIGDVDGDGLLDLVTAQSRANVMDVELSRPGVVSIHAGVRGAMPSATATRTVVGTYADERFGNGLGVLGQGGLAIVAPFADDEGLDNGRLYASLPGSLTEITLPGRASGRRLGQSVALPGDLTGDGIDDLVVGAPRQPDPVSLMAGATMRGIEYGATYVYAGDGASFATSPTATLAGYAFASNAGHSEADRMGELVAAAGDFDGDGRPDVAVVASLEDRPAMFDPATHSVEAACPTTAANDTGVVLIYSGVAAGGTLGPAPTFVIVGPQAGRGIQSIAGDLDVDGDGLDDLVIGGANWLASDPMMERRGGYAVVRGRARAAGGLTSVICSMHHRVEGAVLNDELGYSAARIGDLDADGCDEVAIGARLVDRTGANDEGAVHVMFGFGASCGRASAASIVLFPNDRTSWAGTALAGGADLDGGGRPDLLVGAPRYASTSGEVGRVYLLSGERLASLLGATMPVPFASAAAAGTWYLGGDAAGERLGWSVAIAGRDAVLGGLYANFGGVANSGGVRVIAVGATGFGATRALVAGETTSGYPELGASVAARGTTIAIGATWGSGDVREEGSAYVLDL